MFLKKRSFILTTAILLMASNVFSQKKNFCDMELTLITPADSSQIAPYASFDVKIKLKNIGSDTLMVNDTFVYNLSTFIAVDYRKFALPKNIAPGEDDTLTIHTITNVNDNQNDEYLDFCVRIKHNPAPYASFIDTIDNNNISCHKVLFKTTMGIGEGIGQQREISITPNPANNVLQIKIQKEHIVQLNYNIYNLLGKKVLSSCVPLTNGRLDISLNDLVPGIYWIQLNTQNSGLGSFKFIKQ